MAKRAAINIFSDGSGDSRPRKFVLYSVAGGKSAGGLVPELHGADFCASRSACLDPPVETSCGTFSGAFGGTKWQDESEANELIAKELNSLSPTQREKLFEIIHGVADHVVETEEFIEERLEKMQSTINWARSKEAYTLAHFMSPEFVEDRELRLKILRMMNYDSKAAAKRLINHFAFKLRLFGVDNLVKPISYDILSPDMVRSLRDGHSQLMPSMDKTNRSVLVSSSKHIVGETWRTYFGIQMYLFDKATRCSESQRKGIVYISYNIGYSSDLSHYDIRAKAGDFEGSTTGQGSTIHILYDDPTWALLSVLKLIIGIRLRIRPTFGSHTECMYSLMSYGITPSMLPFDDSGNLEVDENNRRIDGWVEEEREEASRKPQTIIPSGSCVVIGKGYGFIHYVGNRFLAELAERNRERHAAASNRPGKPTLCRAIVKYIQTVRGGRFLKRIPVDESGKWEWVIASDHEAAEKCAQIFRKPRRRDVDTQHESVEYTFDDGRKILVPPPIRLEEWEKILLPD